MTESAYSSAAYNFTLTVTLPPSVPTLEGGTARVDARLENGTKVAGTATIIAWNKIQCAFAKAALRPGEWSIQTLAAPPLGLEDVVDDFVLIVKPGAAP